MFGIGGFNPVSLLATTALGPMGPLAQIALQVVSQIGQNLIQQMGERLDLPQSMIDLAQADYTSSRGDVMGTAENLDEALGAFGRETGATPAEVGEFDRDIQNLLTDSVLNLSGGEEAREARSGGRGGSWLRVMAEALGKKLDASAHEMQDLANKIDKKDPSTTTDFQVASQEFSLLMNAATTAIKTVGEAMANTARKQ